MGANYYMDQRSTCRHTKLLLICGLQLNYKEMNIEISAGNIFQRLSNDNNFKMCRYSISIAGDDERGR